MSTRSESRDHSPDASPEKRASKKRKVLSCYACRSRKMKCDRIYPVCGRCQKTGRADQCTYDPRLLEELPVNSDGHAEGAQSYAPPEHGSGPVSSDLLTWKLRMQERRIESMEKKLASLNGANDSYLDFPSSRFDDFEPEEPHLREEMMFRGKGFKTQFHGSTSALSSLATFGELQAFTREAIISHGNFGRIREDFIVFRNRRKAILKERRLKMHGSDDEIYALVPDKSVVDREAALYFRTWETSYRILHEPTFWKQYHAFWERRTNEEASASFAAVLIYVVAVTKCLEPKEDNVFVGDSSADREAALDLIESGDAWLLRQNRKHLTLQFFQLHCLSLLAKRVNNLKCKQDWVACGDVMRLAISSGLHRNPKPLAIGRVSEYDREMRRRLWLTIVELEAQSSLDCGIQSSVCGLYYDVQPPSNIPDEAFSPETHQIPASRPVEHFTSASFQNMAARSLPLRLHLLQLLNNPTTDMHYTDVLHYDGQLTSLLSSSPGWTDPRAALPLALLELQLRQYLLIIHRPYARLAAKNQRYSYSFTACIDVAAAMLASYESLISKGILAVNHFRSDILRVAATLAQVVYYNCPSTTAQEPAPTMPTPASDTTKPPQAHTPELKIPHLPTNNFLAATLCTTAINLLEKARQLFEHKITRLGTGYMEYWLVCAALGMMPATDQPATSISSIMNVAPDDFRSRGKKALDRVTSHCYRVLSMQKDPENSFASSLRTTITVASPVTPMSNAGGHAGAPPMAYGWDESMPTLLPGASGMAGALAEGKGLVGGAFDGLEDMQVDLSGWAFPDFWAFDIPNGGF
ncbi:hypothetical protein K458DRAFT_431158 [Lentithecium fluviatile CBS 122367]|uniref:Zn(2)-C6 fungal-type domain-containing protein n=1 Tax=Lentithecium fluviatile CBS 122367 TaxID=1168545 RepID=A0A6G1J2Z0_9PLEO|nr:hypothetical protein K458DRAFT_431158 [Lentithecium fluviatile CBS 122367]